MKKYVAFLIIAGMLILAVVAGAVLIKTRQSDQVGSEVPAEEVATSVPRSVITLEEFGDYQCPPCAQLHPTLRGLKKQHGPGLNFVFRNLPLLSVHKNALPAAQAAEAARMQNRFWEMHDLLYENQAIWAESKAPKTQFLKFATDLGLDITRFETDMAGDQVRFRLEADRDAAVRLGIDETPAILINGRKLRTEATNADGVQKGIEVTISRQRGDSAAPSPTNPGPRN